MKSAIIVTSSQGIGIKLSKLSSQFNIESRIHAVVQKNVGELPDISYNNFHYITDIADFAPYEGYKGSFDYLIWCTGAFLQKPLAKTNDYELDTLIDLHYRFPLKIVRELHRQQNKAYHLIVISSCSSWRLRYLEAVYCGLSAAKATFTRNFANDLIHELPGSKIMLINPGGLKTPFFYEEKGIDIQGYLNQDNLAKFIWGNALSQKDNFLEIQYLRNKSVSTTENIKPIIEFERRLPEILSN